MKYRFAAYWLLLSTLLLGCGEHVSMRELNRLEAQLDAAPDSVLSVLTAMKKPQWGERRALHALLTVRAQDKNGINVANDSLIGIATQYYSRRGPALCRLQAFYYHGRVHANAGRYHEAMTAYTHAKEFTSAVDSPHEVGMLYAQMGMLYGTGYDYSQGLIYMEDAQRYYYMAGMERSQHIAKRDIGKFQLNMLHYAEAEAPIREILAWGKTHHDTYIIYTALDLLLRLYDATENVTALDSLFIDYPPETLWKNSATYGTVAYHYARQGDETAARDALAQAWDVSMTAEDTAALLQKSYQVNKMLGYTDEALQYHESLLYYQDSVVRVKLQQPLSAVQRDYYHTQLKISDSRVLTLSYVSGVLVLVCAFIGVAMWGYHHRRLRYKEKELMQLQDTLQQNQAELYKLRLTKADDEIPEENTEEEDATTDSHRKEILRIYRDNIDTSKALFKQSVWATRLDKREFTENKEGALVFAQFKELQEALLSSFSTVVSNLYDEAPNLNDKEVLHCLLCSMGYTSHTVKNCLIASSLDAVRMQKFRMKKKLRPDIFTLFFKD